MTGRLAAEECGVGPPDGPVSLRTGGPRRPSGRLSFFPTTGPRRFEGLDFQGASLFGRKDQDGPRIIKTQGGKTK